MLQAQPARESPAQREEFAKIAPEDRAALLEIRTAIHRLGVPLPAKQIKAAPLDNALEWVAAETDVRIVGDWRALAEVGMVRRSPN